MRFVGEAPRLTNERMRFRKTAFGLVRTPLGLGERLGMPVDRRLGRNQPLLILSQSLRDSLCALERIALLRNRLRKRSRRRL